MPNYREGSNMAFISTNDLSAQAVGSIVKIDSSNAPDHVVLAGANGTGAIGVTLDQAAAGQTISVRLRSASGTLSVKLGGTVAVGDAITSNGSGLGITTVTAGDQVVGYATQAGASGDVIEVIPAVSKV